MNNLIVIGMLALIIVSLIAGSIAFALRWLRIGRARSLRIDDPPLPDDRNWQARMRKAGL